MKTLLFLLALVPISVWADPPTAIKTDDVKAIPVAPGIILKELTGRAAPGSAHSEKCSVAFFHLEPGHASGWSYTKVAEESFFILKGHGEVWAGNRAQKVGPGSFILIPAGMVRSVRASLGEPVEFYAVTSPAWSPDDDFTGKAPASFEK